MTRQVGHHFLCPQCGYDLYTAQLEGACPECGHAIPRRKELEKAKNPRRVNAQHRRRIHNARRALMWSIPLTAAFLAAGIASFWVRWLHGPVGCVAWVFAFFGIIGVLDTWARLVSSTERLVSEDR